MTHPAFYRAGPSDGSRTEGRGSIVMAPGASSEYPCLGFIAAIKETNAVPAEKTLCLQPRERGTAYESDTA